MNLKALRRYKANSGNIKLVPLVLLFAVAAAGAGAWFATKNIAATGGSKRDSSLALEKIQDQLINTLVLPQGFRTVPAFNLTDKNGTSVSNDILKGKWSLLFFGFTHCPDICPTTLTVIDKFISTINTLPNAYPSPQVVFISVDPKRDSPELLKNYVEYFNPEFNALTGNVNDIFALTQPLGIVVSYTADTDNPDNYTVDHTAGILMIDPELQVRAKLNAPHVAEDMVEDYNILLAHLI